MRSKLNQRPLMVALAVVLVVSAQAAVEPYAAAAPAAKAGAAAQEGKASEAPAPSAAAAEPAGAPQADSAAAGAADAATGESGAYTVQLRALEQQVNELKERIFRSKARLNLLKETVLHGVIAGSRAIIKHENKMGSAFRLVKLVYALDGTQIYSRADEEGDLDAKRSFEIFNGSIAPGEHTLSVTMVYRGHGYGIFTYLKGYRFNVRASHTFRAAEGRQNAISVVSYEKGNATTELTERPAVRFETNLQQVAAQGVRK